MDEATRRHLWRIATAPGTTSSALLSKTQAINAFAESGTPVPLDTVREELESVVATPLRTHSANRAISMALQLLADLDGNPMDVYPAEDPEEEAGEGYWPWDRTPPAAGQLAEDEILFLCDNKGVRDHWRRKLEPDGPPWPRDHARS